MLRRCHSFGLKLSKHVSAPAPPACTNLGRPPYQRQPLPKGWNPSWRGRDHKRLDDQGAAEPWRHLSGSYCCVDWSQADRRGSWVCIRIGISMTRINVYMYISSPICTAIFTCLSSIHEPAFLRRFRYNDAASVRISSIATFLAFCVWSTHRNAHFSCIMRESTVLTKKERNLHEKEKTIRKQ